MTCKDCYNHDVCGLMFKNERVYAETSCPKFKDKSKIIELPCRIGDRVYIFEPHLYECVITAFEIISGKENIYKAVCDCCGRIIGLKFTDRNIGKTVFLIREEAEKALEEASNGENKT